VDLTFEQYRYFLLLEESLKTKNGLEKVHPPTWITTDWMSSVAILLPVNIAGHTLYLKSQNQTQLAYALIGFLAHLLHHAAAMRVTRT
jgi:hypothetical protein